MFVPVCDRPSVAKPTGAQDRAVMETKSGTIHRKMPMPARQLPITGSAHKAAVVGDADLAAALTLLDVATQSGGSAGFDGGHHTPLVAAEMTGMGLAVSSTVAAEDVRHLKGRAHAGRFSPVRSVRDAAGRAG